MNDFAKGLASKTGNITIGSTANGFQHQLTLAGQALDKTRSDFLDSDSDNISRAQDEAEAKEDDPMVMQTNFSNIIMNFKKSKREPKEDTRQLNTILEDNETFN